MGWRHLLYTQGPWVQSPTPPSPLSTAGSDPPKAEVTRRPTQGSCPLSLANLALCTLLSVKERGLGRVRALGWARSVWSPPRLTQSPLPRSKQQTCLDCKKNFCPTCSSQAEDGPRLCLLCQRFRATAFQREELMKMKVKDLRDYLSLHDISTETCREKEELVLLVLGQQPVLAQEGRTRTPTLSPDSPEQQAFLSQPHTSTAPATSPHLSPPPAQAPAGPPAQAQESQQVWPRARWLLSCPACLMGVGVGVGVRRLSAILSGSQA